MLQGFYSAASGMMMQQRSLNLIANNLSNAQTPGYKTKRLLSTTFEQAYLARLEQGRYTGIGTGDPVRVVREVSDIMAVSSLGETGRPFDFAISGAGFFNIQGEDGQTYITRDGQFDLDEEGYLVLRGRGRVMGLGGPLKLDTSDILVDEYGEITNATTGAALGRLQLTIPNEDAEILEAATGLYQVNGGTIPAAAPKVVQGALENSSVNLTDEMTQMIMAQRNLASASQALQMIDKTYAKAVNIASL